MPGDRTEQASPHRREKARKEGDLLHSKEFTTAAGTLAGVMTLGAVGGRAWEAWRSGYAQFLNLGAAGRWEPSELQPTLIAMRSVCLSFLSPFALVMAAVVAAALFVGILQMGGVNFNVAAVGLQFNRINPASNIKNLFSLRAGARLGKSLIPASLLSVFAVQRIARELTLPPFSTERLEMLGSDVYGLL